MLKLTQNKVNSSAFDNLSLSEKKQITLLNRINLFIVVILLLVGLFLYYIAIPQSKFILLFSNIFLSLSFLFSIYLNHTSYYKEARYLSLISLIIIVTLTGIIFGKNAKVEYYYLFSAVLSMVLISKKKIVFLFWFINLSLFIFLIWFYQKFTPVLERIDPPVIASFLNPVIAFVLITFLLRVFKNENAKHESELQKRNLIIEKQSEDLRKSDALRSKLYTDISHEIKTPLTLISIPIQELIQEETDPDKKDMYNLILKNSDRLLQLTNQILKLSRLESGNFGLKLEIFDLLKVVRLCVSNFEYIAKQKGILFKVINEYKSLVVKADSEQIQTILNNLLSNAFKYTDNEGSLTVKISVLNYSMVEISVIDTGVGISKEDLPKIFDRFFKANTNFCDKNSGFGLGLDLTKRLTELHNGTIEVLSEIGKGSSFIVKLPILISENHSIEYKETPELFKTIIKPDEKILLTDNGYIESEIHKDEKKVILIVEDNDDMLHYLKRILLKSYSVIEAKDGESAYIKATESIPDIILSDVMMPGTDGIEFCKKLRSDHKLSYIPIILLTAKTFEQDKLFGLESGADYYLKKPFNVDELKLILANTLKRQDQIANYYSKQVFYPDGFLDLESANERFLKKLTLFIEKNLDNSTLNMNDLCQETGYSRSQLFRKTKALTNTSPNEFIRNIRLKKAAILLINKTGNISEILYEVGFNKPSYFSECFKSLYGCTPTEYISENS